VTTASGCDQCTRRSGRSSLESDEHDRVCDCSAAAATIARSSASEEALSLLASLLVINPTKRLTAVAGLTHPYVAAFHDRASALPASSAVEVFHMNDNTKASTSMYRDKLYSMLPFAEEAKGKDSNPFQLSRR